MDTIDIDIIGILDTIDIGINGVIDMGILDIINIMDVIYIDIIDRYHQHLGYHRFKQHRYKRYTPRH